MQGETLTAVLNDPDGRTTAVLWRWARGVSQTGPFTVIAGADTNTYETVEDDLGMFLQATATYTDSTHSAANQTATGVTGAGVVAEVISTAESGISFGAARYHASEAGQVATVLVEKERVANNKSYTVPITVSYGGGATSADVSPITGTVRFGPGSRHATIRVTAIADGVDDDNEWIQLGFGTLPAGIVAEGSHLTTRVDIADSYQDVPPLQVGFAQTTATATEGGQTNVGLRLGSVPEEIPGDGSVWWVWAQMSWTSTLADGIGTSAGAVRTSYGEATLWERFDANRLTRNVRVTCPDDAVRGAAHTLTVNVDKIWLDTSHRGVERFEVGFAAGSNRQLTVTCTENDTAPAPTASYPDVTATLSVAGGTAATVAEQDWAEATVTVTLSADPGRDVRIPIIFTAAAGATGDDFSLEHSANFHNPNFSHTHGYLPYQHNGLGHHYVTFHTGGSLTETFSVQAVDDYHYDPDEYVEVALGDLPERITGTGSVRVNIDDNETPKPVQISIFEPIFSDSLEASEDGGPVTVCVSANINPERRLAVPLTVTYHNGATEADHTPIPTHAIFEQDQRIDRSPRCARISVTAVDDTIRDPGEYITVTLGTPPANTTINPNYNTITIHLTDNET